MSFEYDDSKQSTENRGFWENMKQIVRDILHTLAATVFIPLGVRLTPLSLLCSVLSKRPDTLNRAALE